MVRRPANLEALESHNGAETMPVPPDSPVHSQLEFGNFVEKDVKGSRKTYRFESECSDSP